MATPPPTITVGIYITICNMMAMGRRGEYMSNIARSTTDPGGPRVFIVQLEFYFRLNWILLSWSDNSSYWYVITLVVIWYLFLLCNFPPDMYFINLISNFLKILYAFLCKSSGDLPKLANSRFSPIYICLFICLFKELGSAQGKSHWLHLFGFCPLCVFKCPLISSAREEAKSHW